jgi:hypothetical protein
MTDKRKKRSGRIPTDLSIGLETNKQQTNNKDCCVTSGDDPRRRMFRVTALTARMRYNSSGGGAIVRCILSLQMIQRRSRGACAAATVPSYITRMGTWGGSARMACLRRHRWWGGKRHFVATTVPIRIRNGAPSNVTHQVRTRRVDIGIGRNCQITWAGVQGAGRAEPPPTRKKSNFLHNIRDGILKL